jgi:hypothetical protein
MFFVSLTGTQDYISFNLAGPEMVCCGDIPDRELISCVALARNIGLHDNAVISRFVD